MATKLFVNLPVKNIIKTKEFFTSLGFSYNQEYSNDKALSMIINNDCYVMLLQETFFKTFTKKDIADATKTTEVLVSITAPTRQRVNEMVDKAISLGATEARNPEDMGSMYGRSFADLDGHIWEVIWMEANT